MESINEKRQRRAKAWEDARKFLEERRDGRGMLSAEDAAAYGRMESDLEAMGKEIERDERLGRLEAELSRDTSLPLVSRPEAAGTAKPGRASAAYRSAFWEGMRSRNPYAIPSVRDALQAGEDAEGGYLVPEEYERTLVEALEEENVFRSLAKVIQTSGDRKIPVVATKGSASWIDEEGAYEESDLAFSQVTIGAYKLGTMIKVSEELLNDSVFDLEGYIASEFARRIGAKEEDAFLNGDGSGKPLGVLAEAGGAETGVTAASAAEITADEIIDLYYSLRSPYRKDAVWLLNDSTVKAVRKLKDSNGQYLWQPGLLAGAPDTILGRPVRTSAYMPETAAGARTVLFGDLSYYWIADRQGRTFKRLGELYAPSGQVGFLGSERVDGRLVLSEAVKVLEQAEA